MKRPEMLGMTVLGEYYMLPEDPEYPRRYSCRCRFGKLHAIARRDGLYTVMLYRGAWSVITRGVRTLDGCLDAYLLEGPPKEWLDVITRPCVTPGACASGVGEMGCQS